MLILILTAVLFPMDPPQPVEANSWPLGLEAQFQLTPDELPSEHAVRLGRKLFFETQLSRDNSISCASCHVPDLGFSNGRKQGVGVGGALGARNVPTLINRLLSTVQFWDGRAASLEEQALGPMMASDEMGMSPALVLERISKDNAYRQLFKEAYGTDPNLPQIAAALAAFERTILSGDSPFDRSEWLGEKDALSEPAQRGLALFRGKANCATCHTGSNFTDEKFHNLGVGFSETTQVAGRMAVTHRAEDLGAFKTPTLRNISLTAPYMHDGSKETLAEVIDFYSEGCQPNIALDREIKRLNLTLQEKQDLEAFLLSLTGPVRYVAPNLLAETLIE